MAVWLCVGIGNIAWIVSGLIIRLRESGRICSGDEASEPATALKAEPYLWKSGQFFVYFYIAIAVLMVLSFLCSCCLCFCYRSQQEEEEEETEKGFVSSTIVLVGNLRICGM